jgi:hypothetical protein
VKGNHTSRYAFRILNNTRISNEKFNPGRGELFWRFISKSNLMIQGHQEASDERIFTSNWSKVDQLFIQIHFWRILPSTSEKDLRKSGVGAMTSLRRLRLYLVCREISPTTWSRGGLGAPQVGRRVAPNVAGEPLSAHCRYFRMTTCTTTRTGEARLKTSTVIGALSPHDLNGDT